MSLLQITRGDQKAFTVMLTDGAGLPINLTGLALTFTAKRRPTDTDAQAIIVKSGVAGIDVATDPSTGVATLRIDAADTADLTDLRTLYWDIQVEDMLGDVRTPLSGRLALSPDITRTSGAS